MVLAVSRSCLGLWAFVRITPSAGDTEWNSIDVAVYFQSMMLRDRLLSAISAVRKAADARTTKKGRLSQAHWIRTSNTDLAVKPGAIVALGLVRSWSIMLIAIESSEEDMFFCGLRIAGVMSFEYTGAGTPSVRVPLKGSDVK